MDPAPPPAPPRYALDDWRPGPNKKATATLALGVVALLCMPLLTIVLGPLALALGYVARREIDAQPGRYTNRSMTTIGMVCGGLAIVASVVYIAIA